MAATIQRRVLLGGGAMAAFATTVHAFAIEPRWLECTAHNVPVAGLPRGLDGFSIAHVTDAHLQSLGAVEAAITRKIQSTDVQLVVLTGDIIDSARHLPVLRDFCASLRKQGVAVVATLGNWEHWGDVPLPELRQTYSDLGVELLVNEAITLGDGVRAFATDDSTGGTPDLRKTLESSNTDVSVLLTHSPQFFDALPGGSRFALALAGHTHGGQIRATEHFAPVRPRGSGRFVSGWYELAAGPAYVSRGTGTSIVPARFSCRPELPVFRLRQG